ncbi:SCO family protein [bacterium]|nr:SCO family protein [bacterium]
MRRASTALALALAVLAAPLNARAFEGGGPVDRDADRRGQPSEVRPPELRDVGIDQHLNQPVPLDLPFRNEAGETVTLRSLMRGKPVILSLAYYECPMLCTLVLNGLVSAMRALPFDAGNEFDVITVSFDPTDTPELAARKKATYLQEYRRPGAERGWHFLTGDEASIKQLTDAVGFRYTYLPDKKQFAHAAGVFVLTPDGILSRYFYGVEPAPRDLKFGLMEAADGKIGSPVDQLMLFCFQYDPSTGRYTSEVMTAIRIGGILTLLALGGFMFRTWRQDRRGGTGAATAAKPSTGPARQ